MQQLVANAQAHGAQVPVGGRALAGPGNFFAPTLLVDAPQQAAVCNTEPFGPLAVVRGFDQLITARTGIHATVAENAIQCVAEGTGKSLDSIQDMQDGTMNLSRRKQIN